MFGLRVSFRVMTTFLPFDLISGCCTCGGEITIFSPGFSALMNSSNSMVIFFRALFSAPGRGVLPTKRGGVSSYAPPSGRPMPAQE